MSDRKKIKYMKKIILIIGAIGSLLLAGCNQSNQGGTSDQYNSTNAHGSGGASHNGTNSNANP